MTVFKTSYSISKLCSILITVTKDYTALDMGSDGGFLLLKSQLSAYKTFKISLQILHHYKNIKMHNWNLPQCSW